MDRPTIADVAKAANVSVSTVDRVLNARSPVKSGTAEQVLSAAEKIGFYATGIIRQRLGKDLPLRKFGFVLQQPSRAFYRLLGEVLTDATKSCADIKGRPVIEYLDDLSPQSVSERVLKLGKEVDAIAIVTADHPNITRAIDQLQGDRVPVFALISDLTAPTRAGYVGLDNWKVGRTAAWSIANLCKQPGKVGIFVGSHRYLCQDVCEISFRSYFREHAPEFRVLESLTSLEDSRYAYENALDLLHRNPDLSAIYIAGGGVKGVLRALREEGTGAARNIMTVTHELTDETRAGLIDGTLKMVLSHPAKLMAKTVVDAMVRATDENSREPFSQLILPFDIYTPENI